MLFIDRFATLKILCSKYLIYIFIPAIRAPRYNYGEADKNNKVTFVYIKKQPKNKGHNFKAIELFEKIRQLKVANDSKYYLTDLYK